ncbi:MAG: monovalent cation/H(+) antiporter subunit G [Anaerolineae bacterium]|nr:monovalent cation/H(+) antiporter subunit G [Anaerolineae bacterium]
MQTLLVAALLFIGSAFVLLGSIGLLRLPDLFTRMSSNTKAATLGVGCILLAVALHFNTLAITTRTLAIIAFLFLTAPVAAHMIGRAAFITGIPLWKNSVINELEGRYDVPSAPVSPQPETQGTDANTADSQLRTSPDGQ